MAGEHGRIRSKTTGLFEPRGIGQMFRHALHHSGEVNEDWGQNQPNNVSGDVFNTTYTKVVSFAGGIVFLDFDADDELSIWIDGVLVVDTTGLHSSIDGNTQVYVATGAKRVIVRTRDLGLDAHVRFSISP